MGGPSTRTEFHPLVRLDERSQAGLVQAGRVSTGMFSVGHAFSSTFQSSWRSQQVP